MRLLELSDQQIVKELERLDKEQKAIREEIIRMAWYMRGGVSMSELFESSSADRELIAKLIKDNLDTTKKSGLPFY